MMKIKTVSELNKANTIETGTYETYVTTNVLNHMINTQYDFKVLDRNAEFTLVRIYA